MCDHHRRVSALQLKNGEEAIKVRLRGMRYRLYKRVCASIGVYSSGNEVGHTYQGMKGPNANINLSGSHGKRKGLV